MASAPKANSTGNQKPKDGGGGQPGCSLGFDEIFFLLLLRLFLCLTLPALNGVRAATRGDCSQFTALFFLGLFFERKRTVEEMVGGRFL